MWGKVPCPRIQHDSRDQTYSDLSYCNELLRKVNRIFLLLTKHAFPSDLLVFQLKINKPFPSSLCLCFKTNPNAKSFTCKSVLLTSPFKLIFI